MLITLNNQRTVEIPFEQFDAMSDIEFERFLASDYGEIINDPFYNSQLDSGTSWGPDEDDDIYTED